MSDYASTFCRIVQIYKNKIDFFTVRRFGLRKINFCFIRNRQDINKYFVSSFYCCDAPIDGYSSLSTERTERLSDKVSNINLTHAIEEGHVGTDRYYRVTLDADIYITLQEEIEKVISDSEALNGINDKLFNIYLSGLTDDFLSQLLSEDEIDSDLISGVELND